MHRRDHGGNLDAAVAQYGGAAPDWLDLSTGVNPVAYSAPEPSAMAWTRLPDVSAQNALIAVARTFWNIPDTADILAAPGASALIAQIPRLAPTGAVEIPQPTYNEHAASFQLCGWQVTAGPGDAKVLVHPNNPDGRVWFDSDADAPLTIIDESFADVMPEASLVSATRRPGVIVLKSFGKFWGLAGLRLGFAIGAPDLVARLRDMLGPWAVSGPALEIGTAALQDIDWAKRTRIRLAQDAERLDGIMAAKDAALVGGTTLFRLYRVQNARDMQARLATAHIWTRTFPYDSEWIRLGLPPEHGWARIEAA